MKESFKIGEFEIGIEKEPFLIAEIGINHNGSLDISKTLIDIIAESGWNSVKFQKREPEICVPVDMRKISKETPWGVMSYLDYRKFIEFGRKEYNEIEKYCKRKKLLLGISPWDYESLEFIMQYNLPYIKIPSALNHNKDFIKQVCSYNIPIIISTGMCELDDVDKIVTSMEKYSNGKYVLMHTNSAYPTEDQETNINIIKQYQDRYGCFVGYSGHERGILPSLLAYTLGAVVIERHVTVSKLLWGTDQKASLEISDIFELRKQINRICLILGDGVKKYYEEEKRMSKKLRTLE